MVGFGQEERNIEWTVSKTVSQRTTSRRRINLRMKGRSECKEIWGMWVTSVFGIQNREADQSLMIECLSYKLVLKPFDFVEMLRFQGRLINARRQSTRRWHETSHYSTITQSLRLSRTLTHADVRDTVIWVLPFKPRSRTMEWNGPDARWMCSQTGTERGIWTASLTC